jgi:hypothetical protein
MSATELTPGAAAAWLVFAGGDLPPGGAAVLRADARNDARAVCARIIDHGVCPAGQSYTAAEMLAALRAGVDSAVVAAQTADDPAVAALALVDKRVGVRAALCRNPNLDRATRLALLAWAHQNPRVTLDHLVNGLAADDLRAMAAGTLTTGDGQRVPVDLDRLITQARWLTPRVLCVLLVAPGLLPRERRLVLARAADHTDVTDDTLEKALSRVPATLDWLVIETETLRATRSETLVRLAETGRYRNFEPNARLFTPALTGDQQRRLLALDQAAPDSWAVDAANATAHTVDVVAGRSRRRDPHLHRRLLARCSASAVNTAVLDAVACPGADTPGICRAAAANPNLSGAALWQVVRQDPQLFKVWWSKASDELHPGVSRTVLADLVARLRRELGSDDGSWDPDTTAAVIVTETVKVPAVADLVCVDELPWWVDADSVVRAASQNPRINLEALGVRQADHPLFWLSVTQRDALDADALARVAGQVPVGSMAWLATLGADTRPGSVELERAEATVADAGGAIQACVEVVAMRSVRRVLARWDVDVDDLVVLFHVATAAMVDWVAGLFAANRPTGETVAAVLDRVVARGGRIDRTTARELWAAGARHRALLVTRDHADRVEVQPEMLADALAGTEVPVTADDILASGSAPLILRWLCGQTRVPVDLDAWAAWAATAPPWQPKSVAVAALRAGDLDGPLLVAVLDPAPVVTTAWEALLGDHWQRVTCWVSLARVLRARFGDAPGPWTASVNWLESWPGTFRELWRVCDTLN